MSKNCCTFVLQLRESDCTTFFTNNPKAESNRPKNLQSKMNIFEYAAMREQQFERQMNEMGHERKTTFYADFSIADILGTTQQRIAAIRDTYKRAFSAWKNDAVYLTELVIVLNWKIWEWNEKCAPIAKVYDELWREADKYAATHLKGDDLQYFYETTD